MHHNIITDKNIDRNILSIENVYYIIILWCIL